MHEQVHQRSIDEAAEDGVIEEEPHSSAGQIVDRRRTEGDDEMKGHPEHRSACAAQVRLRSEEAAGDGLRNPDRMARVVDGNGVSKIQEADDQTSGGDRP